MDRFLAYALLCDCYRSLRRRSGGDYRLGDETPGQQVPLGVHEVSGRDPPKRTLQ